MISGNPPFDAALMPTFNQTGSKIHINTLILYILQYIYTNYIHGLKQPSGLTNVKYCKILYINTL